MQTELEKLKILRLSNAESNQITKECLETALLELMATKDISEISITELTKRAGVSRSAFYNNYKTLDTLLDSIVTRVINQVCDFIKREYNKKTASEIYAKFFERIKEANTSFKIFLDADINIDKFLVLENVFPASSIEKHYKMVAKEGAFYRIIVDWFQEGMKESPEEMGILCEKILDVS